jgi:hypothetical protein
MTRVLRATKKLRYYATHTGRALWTRLETGLSHAFSSHASWAARGSAAPYATAPEEEPNG